MKNWRPWTEVERRVFMKVYPFEGASASLRKDLNRSSGALRNFALSNNIKVLNRRPNNYKGYGKIFGSHWAVVKNNADKRKIEFKFTIRQGWNLFLKQKGKCALSGLPIKFSDNSSDRKTQTASLDRIDSSKGYKRQNVQWLHKDINLMKNILTQSQFVKYCKLIANNQK